MILEQKNIPWKVSLLKEANYEEPYAYAIPKNEIDAIEYRIEEKGVTAQVQFYLARTKGYLPIVAKYSINGIPIQKLVTTDIRQIDKNRAFPIRSVNIQYHETVVRGPFGYLMVNYSKLGLKPMTEAQWDGARDLRCCQAQHRASLSGARPLKPM